MTERPTHRRLQRLLLAIPTWAFAVLALAGLVTTFVGRFTNPSTNESLLEILNTPLCLTGLAVTSLAALLLVLRTWAATPYFLDRLHVVAWLLVAPLFVCLPLQLAGEALGLNALVLAGGVLYLSTLTVAGTLSAAWLIYWAGVYVLSFLTGVHRYVQRAGELPASATDQPQIERPRLTVRRLARGVHEYLISVNDARAVSLILFALPVVFVSMIIGGFAEADTAVSGLARAIDPVTDVAAMVAIGFIFFVVAYQVITWLVEILLLWRSERKDQDRTSRPHS